MPFVGSSRKQSRTSRRRTKKAKAKGKYARFGKYKKSRATGYVTLPSSKK